MNLNFSPLTDCMLSIPVLLFLIVAGLVFYPGPLTIYQDRFPTYKNTLVDHIISQPLSDVHISLDVSLLSFEQFRFPDLAQAVELQLDHKLQKLDLICDYSIRVSNTRAQLDFYRLDYVLADTEAIYTDTFERFCVLYYSDEVIASNDLPFFLTQSILSNLFSQEIQALDDNSEIDPPFLDSIFGSRTAVQLKFTLVTNSDEVGFDLGLTNLVVDYVDALSAAFDNLIEFNLSISIQNQEYLTDQNISDESTSYEEILNIEDLSLFHFIMSMAPITTGHTVVNNTVLFMESLHEPNIDAFKTSLERLLCNFYATLSRRSHCIVPIDILTRLTLVKNFIVFASNLKRHLLTDEELVRLLQMRNEAVELANSGRDYYKALNVLLKTNKDMVSGG